MSKMVSWILILATLGAVTAFKSHTALELDNHPCRAEILKVLRIDL